MLASLVMLAAPTLVVLGASFTSGNIITFPPQGFSLKWYGEILGAFELRQAFLRSLYVATIATLLAIPAGLFAALTLARAGSPPLVVERGRAVEDRVRDVEAFHRDGVLDPESNVQFGEGGAGTFSDGKLNTGIKDPLCRGVLDELVRFGAPSDILVKARPHVGTDHLRGVVRAMRQELLDLGAEIRFSTRFIGWETSAGSVCAVRIADSGGREEDLKAAAVVLCPGNAARDTFTLLDERGVGLEAKPFAVGVRIEHLQTMIDRGQYGGRP
ncbi:MAG: hypothetical protein HC897_08135, partial [Thermoanaerobaculia bacterium]|nr:hypothetical protein [Thermoanaerobaculia bacterium]